jgi:DNA-binding transcriptional MerR regulator
MNEPHRIATTTALILSEPEPDTLYPLERVAQFAGLPRRHIVLYVRHGLVRPAIDPADAGWYFTAEAIRTLRRIEMLRALHRLDVFGVRLVLDLMSEIERLRGALFARGW